MKGNRGITLIALVITIIVLLILAGVSIAMLSGDNSIFKKSNEAAKANALATAREQVSIAYNEVVTEYIYKVNVEHDPDASLADLINTKMEGLERNDAKVDPVKIELKTELTESQKGEVRIEYIADGAYQIGEFELTASGDETDTTTKLCTFKWNELQPKGSS